MKLLVTYECDNDEEKIELDLKTMEINEEWGIDIKEVNEKDGYVVLIIKKGFYFSVKKDFAQTIFAYCPVTMEEELEGGYSSCRFELIH